MLNPAPALARGRAAAEALMVDACTIRRVIAEQTSTVDGTVTREYQSLYTGVCRFQAGAGSVARTEDVGEAYLRLLRVEVQLPMSVTGLEVGDEVTCTASVHDADLPGRRFLIRDLAHKTHATARRIRCEEVT